MTTPQTARARRSHGHHGLDSCAVVVAGFVAGAIGGVVVGGPAVAGGGTTTTSGRVVGVATVGGVVSGGVVRGGVLGEGEGAVGVVVCVGVVGAD
jgi:hypothetical protein